MLPRDRDHALNDLACALLEKAGALTRIAHPITQRAIAQVVRIMNSHYSNLIEGHKTNPYDIEKALSKNFSDNPAQKDLQLESIAHIRVQELIEAKLAADPHTEVYAADFLCWIHGAFYKDLPEAFRRKEGRGGERHAVIPGQLRDGNVMVGRHVAPDHESLKAFLNRFEEVYGLSRGSRIDQIIALGAAHHRLSWIHPYLDGNGRVARLMTDAALRQLGVDGHGLWSLSRGLARNRDDYYALLAAADQPRRSDLDGRGRMSDDALFGFCKFFLETALDQIDFMTSRLELDALERRMEKYLVLTEAVGRHTHAATALLAEALRRGEFRRGDAGRITHKGTRTARDILKLCLDKGLLVSVSEKGPVRLGFPMKVLEYYFPLLYPEGIG